MWNKMNSKLLICYCMPEKKLIRQTNKKTFWSMNCMEVVYLSVWLREGAFEYTMYQGLRWIFFFPSVCL